jgi:hypothetical protein
MRELSLLTWKTQLVEGPDAVIYFGLPSSLGIVNNTDILIPVPPGYPQAALDHAFLPEDSPLKGRVAGAVQDNINVAGRTWTRISYHPHGNGGGPPWNPTVHGFHTYVDEILTWLSRR